MAFLPGGYQISRYIDLDDDEADGFQPDEIADKEDRDQQDDAFEELPRARLADELQDEVYDIGEQQNIDHIDDADGMNDVHQRRPRIADQVEKHIPHSFPIYVPIQNNSIAHFGANFNRLPEIWHFQLL